MHFQHFFGVGGLSIVLTNKSVFLFSIVPQVVDREVFLAGFDLNEDSTSSSASKNVFNGTLGTNLTEGKVYTVELFGMQCGKEYYAISVAAAVTFLAGVYQVKGIDRPYCPKASKKIQHFTPQSAE